MKQFDRMNQVKSSKKTLLIVGIILGISYSIIPHHTSAHNTALNQIYLIEWTTHKVWNGTAVNEVYSVNDEHILLMKGSNELILLKNQTEVHTYQSMTAIRGVAALKESLFFISNESFWILRYENFTTPVEVLDWEMPCARNLGAYKHYVYHPCYEWGGFLIYDFSNITNPKRTGNLIISWHAYEVNVVGDYGFFEGDTASGIYYLKENPEDPKELWKYDKPRSGAPPPLSSPHLRFQGRPAVSNQYFAFIAESFSQKFFGIIPRINTTICGEFTRINITEKNDYFGCILIQENILVAADTNNTLTLFEISSKLEMEKVSEIYLGNRGGINNVYYDKLANEIYVADGANGLIRMNISVTKTTTTLTTPTTTFTSTQSTEPPSTTSTPPTQTPGFTLLAVLSMITMMARVKKTRKKS